MRNIRQMIKKPSGAEAKAAEVKRKAELSAQLDKDAQAASERIRRGFDEERQRLARRYGVGVHLSSEAARPKG
jgi:hypothetical protein